MSIGEVEDDAEASEFARERFAGELSDGEDVRLTWTATEVRWANQWGYDLDSPTAFAATDRRILFETPDGVTSIGYNRMRAVNTDAPNKGPDLSVGFLVCGGLCLVIGLLASLRDFVNGAALVALSMALLVAGSAMGTRTDEATVTIVVGNERQRLSFSAAESIGTELADLVTQD